MFLSVASLRASSPIRESEASLAKPRGAEERSFLGPSHALSREARFARLNRRACSQAIVLRKTLLVRFCVIVMWVLFSVVQFPGGEGGGTPLYKPYRYVPPHRVGFLRRFGLKTSTDFTHFGLESGMVFEGTTGVYERINCLIPNE